MLCLCHRLIRKHKHTSACLSGILQYTQHSSVVWFVQLIFFFFNLIISVLFMRKLLLISVVLSIWTFAYCSSIWHLLCRYLPLQKEAFFLASEETQIGVVMAQIYRQQSESFSYSALSLMGCRKREKKKSCPSMAMGAAITVWWGHFQ